MSDVGIACTHGMPTIGTTQRPDKSVSGSGSTIETAKHGRTDAALAPQVAISHA